MPAKTSLIYWTLFSLALHGAGLIWCPAPGSLSPPSPLYLVVDLFSGPATSGNSHGLDEDPSGGRNTPPATKITTKDSLQPPQPAKARSLPPRKEKARSTQQPKKVTSATKPHEEKPVPTEPVNHTTSPKKPASGANVNPESLTPLEVPTEVVTGQEDNQPNDPETAANRCTSTTFSVGSTSGAVPGRGSQLGSGSPVETPMAYGTNPPPPYPRTARRRGWEGEVLLLVNVTAQGEVFNVSVSRSSGYQILDQAAKNSVHRWKFQAAQRNGRAVAGQVMVPIRFSIKDAQ